MLKQLFIAFFRLRRMPKIKLSYQPLHMHTNTPCPKSYTKEKIYEYYFLLDQFLSL